MEKARKIMVPIIALICILAIGYFLFFFGENVAPKDELTTSALKEYTISFATPELKYSKGANLMEGVRAKGANNEDLTGFVTVSCKPTKNMYKKILTYSINKPGYKISSVNRDLILDKTYKGPSIKIDGTGIELPLNQAKKLSSAVSNSDIIKTNDGFGNKCSISATIANQGELTVGDYVATVTAQNILGDTVSQKITVTFTEAEESIIKLSASSITIKKGEKFEPKDYVVSAYYNKEYGDVAAMVVASKIDTSKAGVYTVEYRIKDIGELQNEVAHLYVTVN